MNADERSRERLMAWLGVVMALFGLLKAIQRLREVNKSSGD
jgi:hypothetical protein